MERGAHPPTLRDKLVSPYLVACVRRYGRAQWVKEPSQPRPPNASRHVLPAVVASGGVKESRVEILLSKSSWMDLGGRAWPSMNTGHGTGGAGSVEHLHTN